MTSKERVLRNYHFQPVDRFTIDLRAIAVHFWTCFTLSQMLKGVNYACAA